MVKMELLKIETQRLLLRQFAIGDAEDVFAILSDEQTTLDCGGYHAFEEMDEEYERLMQKFAAQTRYSIVCRETGRVIGMMSMMDAERAVPGWEFGIESHRTPGEGATRGRRCRPSCRPISKKLTLRCLPEDTMHTISPQGNC